jgi:hypothetical protein
MAKKLQVTPKLPTLQDIANSVSETEYRQAIAQPKKVMEDWDKFKKSRGGGAGLTMISDIDPEAKSTNLKIAKNANHPSELVRATHQMSMSLANADTSGVFEGCHGCRTPECTALCNSHSGHYGMEKGTANRAKQVRSAYWAENPQFAGALAVIQSRRGARAAREIGMIPAMRSNMWTDVPWHKTTLAGPWIADFEGKGSTDSEAIGLAKDHPLMTHMNYTKEKMNRVLRPGEKEPEADAPSNYYLTGSISEQTPTKRVQQRHDAGLTTQAALWLGKDEPKPERWVMQDPHGNEAEFDLYDADNTDARMHDVARGFAGKTGGLTVKRTAGLKTMEGAATESSFVRPVRPDIPVGQPGGIPKQYASPDVIQRQKIRGILDSTPQGASSRVRNNMSGQQFQFGESE